MLKNIIWADFFGAPIQVKRYQNTSGLLSNRKIVPRDKYSGIKRCLVLITLSWSE